LTGQIIEENADPVGGARVHLEEAAPARPRPNQGMEPESGIADGVGHEGRVKRTASAGEDGRFQLNALDPARYTLTIRATGYPRVVKEVELEDAAVDLGAIVLSNPETVTGVVLSPDGRPVADARVWLEELPLQGIELRFGENRLEQDPPTLVETKTERNGEFVLSELIPGTYTLVASSFGFARSARTLVETGRESVEVRLRDGGTGEGRVIDEDTGAPVVGAEITPWVDEASLDLEKTTVTDEEGLFHIAGLERDPPRAVDRPWRASACQGWFFGDGRWIPVGPFEFG
jgi:hypothetical protein